MGMYTALVLDARLKRDTPDDVIEILKYMAGGDDGHVLAEPSTPDHPLFGATRWRWMLQSGSAYFPIERQPLLYRPPFTTENIWLLSVGCSLKNYGGEIGFFLDWLKPYVEEGLGYWIYEEDDKVTPIHINWPVGDA